MPRIVRLLVVTLGAVVLATGPAASSAHAAEPSTEHAFVSRINSLRASKGLRPLAVDGELTTIGRRWAARMASTGTLAHNPGFAGEVTANWVKLGENVGVGPDLDGLFRAFVDSPTHYRNLVDPDWTHVGVGVVVVDGMIWTSHQFEQLATAPAPPTTAAPTSPAATTAAPMTAAQTSAAPTTATPRSAPEARPVTTTTARPRPPAAPAEPHVAATRPATSRRYAHVRFVRL